MIKSLKKILKNFLLSNKEELKIENPITGILPVDLIPIDKTLDEDVFIVGFPKSGNTLMQHIITHLVYGINEEGSRTMVNFIVPDIYSNKYYVRFNDTCYFKSHNLPEKHYKKVIYIIRDGREALLSYYHMMKNSGNELSLEELYSGKLKIFNVTWQEHIKSWENNPYNANVLWTKFEDLKKDKLTALKRICNFINLERTDNELNNVIKLTSLEHMKMLEQKKDWIKMKKDVFIKGNNFIRKGEVDSFNKEVPEELINDFEKVNMDLLKRYDYKI